MNTQCIQLRLLQQAVAASDQAHFRKILELAQNPEAQAQAVQAPETLQNLEDFVSALSTTLREAKNLLAQLKGQKAHDSELETLRNHPLLADFLWHGAHSMPSEHDIFSTDGVVHIKYTNTHPKGDVAYYAPECHEEFLRAAYGLLKTLFPTWPRPMLLRERTESHEAIYYAEFVAGARVPELEPLILSNAEAAGCYAYWVMKQRWPEAEEISRQNPDYAKTYQSFVADFPPCVEEPGRSLQMA